MNQKKLDDIRRACIAANATLKDRDIHCPRCECMDTRSAPQEIRLADILGAIREKLGDPHSDNFMEVARAEATLIGDYWNLRKDDLTQQSEETIDFIHSLLYPKV